MPHRPHWPRIAIAVATIVVDALLVWGGWHLWSLWFGG
jgi:hypothetical protein